MKIKWLGHSCFLITTSAGTRIITDPFTPERNMSYAPVSQAADIVTVSHGHQDHNHVAPIQGTPHIFTGNTGETFRDVAVRTVKSWHDESGGKERGPNLIFCFKADDINVCHLGDLGYRLKRDEIDALGRVDVLLIPVGGIFTIDAAMAARLCEDMRPGIAIPMHYKNKHCQWLKWTANDFVGSNKNFQKIPAGEIEITASTLPAPTQIIILDYIS